MCEKGQYWYSFSPSPPVFCPFLPRSPPGSLPSDTESCGRSRVSRYVWSQFHFCASTRPLKWNILKEAPLQELESEAHCFHSGCFVTVRQTGWYTQGTSLNIADNQINVMSLDSVSLTSSELLSLSSACLCYQTFVWWGRHVPKTTVQATPNNSSERHTPRLSAPVRLLRGAPSPEPRAIRLLGCFPVSIGALTKRARSSEDIRKVRMQDEKRKVNLLAKLRNQRLARCMTAQEMNVGIRGRHEVM